MLRDWLEHGIDGRLWVLLIVVVITVAGLVDSLLS